MGLGYFISTSAILISAISYFLFLYFYLLLEFFLFNYFFKTVILNVQNLQNLGVMGLGYFGYSEAVLSNLQNFKCFL